MMGLDRLTGWLGTDRLLLVVILGLGAPLVLTGWLEMRSDPGSMTVEGPVVPLPRVPGGWLLEPLHGPAMTEPEACEAAVRAEARALGYVDAPRPARVSLLDAPQIVFQRGGCPVLVQRRVSEYCLVYDPSMGRAVVECMVLKPGFTGEVVSLRRAPRGRRP